MTGAAALITSLSLILRLPSRRKAEVSAPVSESSEARQKFANAKAISSDMFFGRESSAEVRSSQDVFSSEDTEVFDIV